MISVFLAVWLSLPDAVSPTEEVDTAVRLNIDPCVEIDEPLVRRLVNLELQGIRPSRKTRPNTVSVGCTDDRQEIRIEPWATAMPEGIRSIQLVPIENNADVATLQGRSRELALAIAEFIRRLETIPLPGPAPKEAPPPPEPPPPPPPPPPSIHLLFGGVLPSVERFADGYTLVGGDLVAAYRPGRWFIGEIRAGARAIGDETIPQGRLSARAGTVGAALGLSLLSPRFPVGVAIMLRATGYLVRFQTESTLYSQHASLTAMSLAAGPVFSYALTTHVTLTAAIGVGRPLRGIAVRLQGAEFTSMTGYVLSGSLGAGITF